MPTPNQELYDALIRHQIGLLGLSARVSRRIVDLLNEAEKDLRGQLERRLQYLVGRGISAEDFTTRRYRAILDSIAELRADVFSKTKAELREEMLALVKHEATFIASAIEFAAPVVLEMARPDSALLSALVTHNPFEGRTLSEWAEDIRRADIKRINDAINIGLVQGETIQQITARVIGTQALNGRNGATQMTRNQVAGLVRTAVNSYSNQARRIVFEANKDIVEEEVWVSVLDSRTTLYCASQGGKVYPVGEGPYPPAHWNCRSVRVALMAPALIGDRPFNPTTERQLLREFADARNIPVALKRADLPHGFKLDFDKFARARTRELVGQVPASTTFEQWFKRQPAWFKRDYLGETRAELFTKGKLSLSDLVGADARPFTLAELAKLEARAFERAGLDVEAFV